jgi:predicted GTPase
VPDIIFVANKAEEGFEGDILGDFYLNFPDFASKEVVDDPIFISAEHGDGLADLYSAIKNKIP